VRPPCFAARRRRQPRTVLPGRSRHPRRRSSAAFLRYSFGGVRRPLPSGARSTHHAAARPRAASSASPPAKQPPGELPTVELSTMPTPNLASRPIVPPPARRRSPEAIDKTPAADAARQLLARLGIWRVVASAARAPAPASGILSSVRDGHWWVARRQPRAAGDRAGQLRSLRAAPPRARQRPAARRALYQRAQEQRARRRTQRKDAAVAPSIPQDQRQPGAPTSAATISAKAPGPSPASRATSAAPAPVLGGESRAAAALPPCLSSGGQLERKSSGRRR